MSTRIAAGPKRVELAAIERELEALWISLPAAGGPAGAGMTMRSVVANLVAVRSSAGELARAAATAGKIIGNHPCRIILVTAEPDLDPPELTAEVAVICQQSETCQRCVYCDRISLAGRGIMADNLPSTTAALLAPDLPVILWCPHPPFGRKDFERFAQQAGRVIVDSADYDRNDLRQLAGFIERSRRTGTAVSDLNWARLTIYRQVFAQLFDAPECRGHLAAIQSTRIEAAPAAGLLLAGWLQAQLEKNGYPLPRGRIALISAGAEAFAFQALAMACADGRQSFTVIRRDADTIESRMVRDARTTSRVVKAALPSEDQLLGDELTFAGRDAVFETSLAAAAALED